MTSPSHKNHRTTAQLRATRAEGRSLWQHLLAGALCLCVTGAIPANDREGTKPLERLKQRSARQRWREMRGDWMPGPDAGKSASPTDVPASVGTPNASQMRQVPRPVPVVTNESPASPAQVPVPEPVDVAPQVAQQPSAHPGAKPPADPNEPATHLGSFSEVPVEVRVSMPRERVDVPLPHWPFEDDLDLVGQRTFEETPTDSIASPQARLPKTVNRTIPVESDFQPLQNTSPVQVADASQTKDAPETEGTAPDPEAITDSLVPEEDIARQLKSIKDIQPFFDYSPNGGDPNEVLCPRPANSEPNKTYKQCPPESSLVENGSLERNHSVIPVYWQASNVYHNPLYFEDPGLERTGHTFSELVQPFVSVGRFGAQVVALPYSIALDPMCKVETPLGHYRPGECAPKRHLAVPLNPEAAATAAAAYTGIIFLIP